MRKGFLGSLAVLAAGAGLAFGQPAGAPPGPPMGPYGLTPGLSYGPPQGMPAPPPGAVPGPGPIPAPGPSGPGPWGYTSPDGHPLIMPPGLEGMVPPGSMGAGAPGGVAGWDNGPGNGMGGMGGPGGGAKGLLPGLFGGGVYFGADYLYWVPKSQDVHFPLVTTSAPAVAGIPGSPSTVALCGPNDDISYDQVNGVRVWVGYGLGDSGLACEVGGFWLLTAHRDFNFASNSVGEPLLAIPFIDAATMSPASFVIAAPAVAAGGIDIAAATRVRSAEASMVWGATKPDDGMPGGIALLAGARYFDLEESLDIRTQSTSLLTGVSTGTLDHTRTFNHFYGGQVGFRGDIGFGKWFVQATGKVAAGYMRQWVDIDGSSTAVVGGVSSTRFGGIFNAPEDLCRHHKDRFAYLSEAGLNVGCQLTSFMRIHAGYTFIYTNSVLRPTSVMTPVLNTSSLPLSPTFGAGAQQFVPRDVVRDTEFHLHGVNVGVQFSF